MSQLFMVFDVESVGLHGEGYAVGYVVLDRVSIQEMGCFACDPANCRGPNSGREWVEEHGAELVETHRTPKAVREAFWAKWQHWKARGAVLAADVAWPVESRFLCECVDDARPLTRGGMQDGPRDFEGPYPLIDIASLRMAKGKDPLAAEQRMRNELPIHDPLADAKQSARLLLECVP